MGRSAFSPIKLEGLEEIRATLRTLPLELQDKVMRTALARAAQPVADAAKRNAGRIKRTGALQESIGVVVKRGKKGGDLYALVGPRRGYYRGGKRLDKTADARGSDSPAHYAHLVEFGHMAVAPIKGTTLRKKTAQALRFVPAKPFMRPAILATQDIVGRELANGIADGIDRTLQRLVKNPKAAR